MSAVSLLYPRETRDQGPGTRETHAPVNRALGYTHVRTEATEHTTHRTTCVRAAFAC